MGIGGCAAVGPAGTWAEAVAADGPGGAPGGAERVELPALLLRKGRLGGGRHLALLRRLRPEDEAGDAAAGHLLLRVRLLLLLGKEGRKEGSPPAVSARSRPPPLGRALRRPRRRAGGGLRPPGGRGLGPARLCRPRPPRSGRRERKRRLRRGAPQGGGGGSRGPSPSPRPPPAALRIPPHPWGPPPRSPALTSVPQPRSKPGPAVPLLPQPEIPHLAAPSPAARLSPAAHWSRRLPPPVLRRSLLPPGSHLAAFPHGPHGAQSRRSPARAPGMGERDALGGCCCGGRCAAGGRARPGPAAPRPDTWCHRPPALGRWARGSAAALAGSGAAPCFRCATQPPRAAAAARWSLRGL